MNANADHDSDNERAVLVLDDAHETDGCNPGTDPDQLQQRGAEPCLRAMVGRKLREGVRDHSEKRGAEQRAGGIAEHDGLEARRELASCAKKKAGNEHGTDTAKHREGENENECHRSAESSKVVKDATPGVQRERPRRWLRRGRWVQLLTQFARVFVVSARVRTSPAMRSRNATTENCPSSPLARERTLTAPASASLAPKTTA